MLIDCPECKQQVSDKAKVCPNCGYKLHKSITAKIVIVLVFIAFVIAGILIVLTFRTNAKLNEAEQAVYTIMQDICSRADYPAEVKLIDSAVSKSKNEGVYDGFVKVTVSGKQYYVTALYKNGEYEVTKLDDSLKSQIEDLFDYDNGVDEKKVQKKLTKYYN